MGKTKYTDEFLISELQRFHEENGRSPTATEMRIKNGYPPATAYYTYFGSFTNALKCANLEINHATGYTNDQLIQILQEFYNNTGRSPIREDINNLKNCPSYGVFVERFGSWTKALEAASIPINVRYDITQEYLINELHRFVSLYNRSPTMNDFRCNSDFPSYATYQRYFNTWSEALEIAGLDSNTGNKYTKTYLINKLIDFYNKNQRVPTRHDLSPINGYPCQYTFTKYFDSYNNAILAANLTPNKITHIYNGTETCSICGSTNTYDKWNYDKDNNILCRACTTKKWFSENPNKLKQYKYLQDTKRRGYGVYALNIPYEGSAGHHLWLENNNSILIHIPEFLHKLHWHSHHKLETMETINTISLDYWIQEDFYKKLYLTGERDG